MKGKIISIVVFVLIVVVILKVIPTKKSLGGTKKISQKRCKEAFKILEQIQGALKDKKKLNFLQSSWLSAINNL